MGRLGEDGKVVRYNETVGREWVRERMTGETIGRDTKRTFAERKCESVRRKDSVSRRPKLFRGKSGENSSGMDGGREWGQREDGKGQRA